MFRVRWERRALDELTRLWTQADSATRQAITTASHTIDQRLRQNPQQEGESRPRGRRIAFIPPLAVVFRVEADGQTVSVLQIRLFRRRAH
jgi:plasmid stabilization system protein ParE